MNPTLMQLCALDSERNWSVSTGAGAGKTLCLTQRYIGLLERYENLKVGQILTLTFTQKAASEMRGRIYQRINEKLGAADLTSDLRKRFIEIKEGFADSSISTFHAFCAALLRGNPVESKVDSDFTVASDFEREQILTTAFEEVLHRYIWRDPKGGSTDRNTRYLTLLECWDHRMIRQITFHLLSNPERYESFTQTLSKVIRNEESFLNRILRRGAEKILQDLKKDNFLEDLAKAQEYLQSSQTEHKDMSDLVEQLSGIFVSLSGPDDLLRHYTKLCACMEHPAVISRQRSGKGLLTAKQIADHMLDSGLLQLDMDLERNSLQYLSLLVVFINEVHLHYLDHCRVKNLLDFHFLQQKVLELLQAHPEVLERERLRYQYLLVDEFQDTDALQWKILKLLASDSSGNLQSTKLFIVGDEKQSIYAFRGGEVRIFNEASAEIRKNNISERPLFFEGSQDPALRRYAEQFSQLAAQNPEQASQIRAGSLIFYENFRSHKTPTEFFNQFFERLFEPQNGLDPVPQQMICMKEAHEQAGSVQIMVIPSLADRREERSDSENEEDLLDLHLSEAKFIANHLQQALQNSLSGSVAKAINEKRPAVAILFRRFTKVKAYEEILRQAKIDFFVHRGKGFFRRQEILDLYNILEFLHDNRKDIHLIGLLRAPVFGLPDAEIFQLCKNRGHKSVYHLLQENHSPQVQKIISWLKTWRELKDRLRLSELLRLIILETSWNGVFALGNRGKQTLYNVEKFIEIARQFEEKGKKGLAEFCAFIREKIDHDEQEGEALLGDSLASPVVLMTIHQAKGLQFPMVVMPDLNARFRYPTGDLLEVLDEPDQYYYGIRCPNPNKGYVKQPTTACLLLQKRARLRLEAEEKRLFYVGCTRAIEHLILVGEVRNKEKCENKSPGSVWDWLQGILKIEQGVKNVQLGEKYYPVNWYESTEPLQKEIQAVTLPDKMVAEPASIHLALNAIETKSPIRISPTALVTFRDCRRKFYYRELLSIPENLLNLVEEKYWKDEVTLAEEENDQKRLYAGLSGSIVHHILEDADNFKEGNLSERIQSLLEQERVNLRIEGEVDAHVHQEILAHLTSFAQDPTYLPLFQKLKRTTPKRIFSEVPFEVRLGNVLLRGQIDKLFQPDENGLWTVLDFKTP